MTQSELTEYLNAEPEAECSLCGRKTWDIFARGEPCGMTQPDGKTCYGKFIAMVDTASQDELVGMLMRDGIDPDEMICRTCGAIYDGGQTCSYCGDHNPTDDAEMEFGDY